MKLATRTSRCSLEALVLHQYRQPERGEQQVHNAGKGHFRNCPKKPCALSGAFDRFLASSGTFGALPGAAQKCTKVPKGMPECAQK
eukprot:13210065-Alexandrium_andersonii.AAC.1